MSSNSSVQRVVLQALSNIQLQEVEAIQKALPTLSALIRNLLSDYVTPDRRLAWERLFRALNRFDDWHELSPDIGQESPVPNSLSLLFHRGLTDDAIQFLRQQIIKPTVKLDALSWARILRNVLWEGVHWLDVNDNNSKVWTSFRDWFLYHHTCNKGVHESRTVWTVKLLCQTQLQWKRENLFLHIVEPASRLYEPPKSTSDGVNLQDSIFRFFRSSVSHFLTSNVLEGLDIPTSLPGEIRLHLALLQSPATLETSAPYNTETQQKAPLGKLIDILRVYVDLEVESSGWRGGTLAYHPEVTGAIFKELYTILNSPSFDAIRLRDRQDMLHPLIRTLVLDGELREKHGTKWLSATVIDRIINATFADPDTFVAPVVNEILDYYLFCRSRLAEEVYRHLLSADWAVVADRESADGLPEDPTEEADEGQQYTYPFLISSYIDGFQFLKEDCSALYEQSVEYISRPRNLLAISKILVLGDIESRTRMWKLASLLQRDNWTTVLDDVDLYLGTEAASARYENQVDWLEGVHPFHLQVHITWTDFEELEVFVAQFRDAIRQESVLFPLVTPVYNMPKQKDFFKPIPEAPN